MKPHSHSTCIEYLSSSHFNSLANKAEGAHTKSTKILTTDTFPGLVSKPLNGVEEIMKQLGENAISDQRSDVEECEDAQVLQQRLRAAYQQIAGMTRFSSCHSPFSL